MANIKYSRPGFGWSTRRARNSTNIPKCHYCTSYHVATCAKVLVMGTNKLTRHIIDQAQTIRRIFYALEPTHDSFGLYFHNIHHSILATPIALETKYTVIGHAVGMTTSMRVINLLSAAPYWISTNMLTVPLLFMWLCAAIGRADDSCVPCFRFFRAGSAGFLGTMLLWSTVFVVDTVRVNTIEPYTV